MTTGVTARRTRPAVMRAGLAMAVEVRLGPRFAAIVFGQSAAGRGWPAAACPPAARAPAALLATSPTGPRGCQISA
jgi:hypothetical protein